MAQDTDLFCIECGQEVAIEIPAQYQDTLFSYEEGYYKTLIWQNGDYLTIHCGSMTTPEFSDTTRYLSNSTHENDIKITRKGAEIKTGKCWGAARIKGVRLRLYYLCQPESKHLFDKIFHSTMILNDAP